MLITLKHTLHATPTTSHIEISRNHVRLDECLACALSSSRNQAQTLIKHGRVRINGSIINKCAFMISAHALLEILPLSMHDVALHATHDKQEISNSALDSLSSHASTMASLHIPIIYEDEGFLILNKPSNLVVHGAPSVKEPTLVDWLHAQGIMLSTLSGAMRAGIVHRLDKQTSGAIAIAKTNATHAYLSKELQERRMGRYYLAIIDKPLHEPRMITCLLARHPNNRLKMTNIHGLRQYIPRARFSQSAFLPLLSTQEASLIAIKLYTGRTHQIRAHLESINRHILGDNLYGYVGKHVGRIMLHAYMLYLIHPHTRADMMHRAEVLGDMLQCGREIFGAREFDEAIECEHIMQAFATWDSASRA